MLSGDVADRAIELLQDLSNVSTGNAMDLIQDLLTLLPPDIQEVIASSDDPIALLGELKEFLIGQGQLPESGTTEDVGNILESSSVNGDAAVEDVFSVARPRTSPPNVSRVSRPPTGPSNSLFESRDIPSTPGFLMRRTSTHLSSPWQASSQASPPLLPGSPFKLNNSKLSFHAYPKKASSFSLGRTMDKENPEGTLPDWLVTDQPGKSGPTFEHGDASVSSSSGIPPDQDGLLPNTSFSFNASSIMHPPPMEQHPQQQEQQAMEEKDTTQEDLSQYILTPSKALAKKLRDSEKALQVSDERIMELEKRLEAGLKDGKDRDQEVLDLKMREKTFKGSIISMENTIDGLNAQLSEQAQVMEDYKAKVDAAKDIEVRFQSELDWRASEIDDLRGLIAKYDKETKELQTSLQTVQGQLEVSQRDGLVSNETAQEYSKTVHNLQQELALWKTKKPEVVVQKPILVSSGMQSDPIPVVKPEWEVVDIPTQTDRVPLLNSFVQTDALVEKAVPLTSSVECQTECLTADDSFDAVLQDFEHQLEVKKEIEEQVEALLASTDTLERENATLKSQLTHVQTQVLETRKLLDKRRQFDSEVDRWISTLKTDLTQTEFVAGLSHKDMDMTVDAMEMLKDRLSNVEDELTIERGRIGLLGASASRPKADKGVQAEVQVMTTGTYSEPIEIQTSLSIMPHSQPETLTHTSSATSSMVLHQEKTTSSFGSSLWRGFLWVSFASLLYSWVVNQSTNRQPDMLSLLLTWIDDLLDSSANELVLM